MLVLSRKVNERIQIGDEITITVVRISPNSVRIGINAPPRMMIARDELNGVALSDAALSVGSSDDASENGMTP